MNPQLHKFITTGERPGTQKELSAVLDSARNLILQQTKPKMITFPTETQKRETLLEKMTAEHRVKNGMPPAPHTRKLVATAPRPAPSASKPAVVNRATATATKPAPAPSAPAQLTAAQYATPPLVMGLDEFKKLTPADRMRFVKDGGKLA